MANIVSQNTSPTLNLKNIEDLGSTLVDRNFGRPEDYINIHIYDLNNNLLNTVENFKEYKSEQNTGGLIQDLNLDPLKILNELGYTTGTYNLKVNIQKRKIFNTTVPAFKIKEISSTRTELKLTTVLSSNNINLANNSRNFIQAVQNSTYFRDFILNFGKDRNITAVNIALDTSNSNDNILQIKLLEPLLENLKIGDKLSIVENIVDPIILTYDLGLLPSIDTTVPIKGPNFKIDTRLNSSVPTAFRSYDDILSTSTTSSYQKLLSKLDGYEIPEIDYGYVRSTDTASLDFETVTPTHFENFVHFGSATELLKNFEYKLKLIEVYNKQINEISEITTTNINTTVLNVSSSISNKKESLIQGFSGYEQFLYFESGAYSWPKSGSHPQIEPYAQSHTTSSEALTWLGSSNSTNPYFGGQLSSASIFDKQNPNRLMKLVPSFIGDREENQPFELFCDMIGEHFDPVWTHVKEITQTTDNSHKLGVSKDLVYYMLQNLGIEAYDQFENEDLINYIFGQATVTNDTSAVITGSNEVFAKQDISKEIWKRLYHNAPYLLKTKGTERGLRALINCYGIPNTVLDIKEFGSSDPNRDEFKLYTYEKFTQVISGNSLEPGNKKGMFIETAWTSSNTNAIALKPSSSAKTVEFRIKPTRSGSDAYHLFSLSNHTSQSLSGSDLHLVLHPYTGSHDFFTVGDKTQYGKLDLLHFTSSILTSSGHQITSPVELIENGSFDERLGSELVVGGEFSTDQAASTNNLSTYWSTEAGWKISGGQANTINALNFAIKQNTGEIVNGKAYRITGEITNYESGQLAFGIGASGDVIVGNSVGKFSIDYTSNDSNTDIIFRGTFSGSIDNVSVKEANVEWTTTDYGNGTGTTWVISGGKANRASSGGSNNWILQPNLLTVGKTYQFTFDLIATAGSIQHDSGTGAQQFTTTGTHTDTFVASLTQFQLKANNAFRGSIDNVTVKEVLHDSEYFPMFNGNFWDISLGTDGISGSDSTIHLGAYQSNHLRDVLHYTSSATIDEVTNAESFGSLHYSDAGNLIVNNDFTGFDASAQTVPNWTLQDTGNDATFSLITDGIKVTIDSTPTNTFDVRVRQDILHQNLKLGHKYRISFEARTTDFNIRVHVSTPNGHNDQPDPDNIISNGPSIDSSDFNYYQTTFETTYISNTNNTVDTNPIGDDGDLIFHAFFTSAAAGDTFEIRNIQIEELGACSNAFFGGIKNVTTGGIVTSSFYTNNNLNGFNLRDDRSVFTLGYKGSMSEIRYYFGELLNHNTLQQHALEPLMYGGNSISSSFDHLVLRYPLSFELDLDNNTTSQIGGQLPDGTTVVGGAVMNTGLTPQFTVAGTPLLQSHHPNTDIDYLDGFTYFSNKDVEEIVEEHHLPTPNTIGKSPVNNKIRIDKGTTDDDILSPDILSQLPTTERQVPDFSNIGIYLSPQNEINEDIIYTLGTFSLDEFLGDPREETSETYEDFKPLVDQYFKKLKKGKDRYNIFDFTRWVSFLDHTLFDLIKSFTPQKSIDKTGILIEPHFLERPKFRRYHPIVSNTTYEGDLQEVTQSFHKNNNISLLDGTSGSAVISYTTINYPDTYDGIELVLNPDFSNTSLWNQNSNWTVSNGVATSDGSSNNNINRPLLSRHDGSIVSSPSSNPSEEGIHYRVIFEIKTLTSGTGYSVRIGQGNNTSENNDSPTFTTVGVHTAFIKSEGTHPNYLYVIPVGNAAGTIDNISVKELKLSKGIDSTLGYNTTIDVAKALSGSNSWEQGPIRPIFELVRNPNLTGSLAVSTNTLDWDTLSNTTIGSGIATITALGNIGSTANNWSLSQDLVFPHSDPGTPGTTNIPSLGTPGNGFNEMFEIIFRARQTTGTGDFQVGMGYHKFFDEQITNTFKTYKVRFRKPYLTSGTNSSAHFIALGGNTATDVFEVDSISIRNLVDTSLEPRRFSRAISGSSLDANFGGTQVDAYTYKNSDTVINGSNKLRPYILTPRGNFMNSKISKIKSNSINKNKTLKLIDSGLNNLPGQFRPDNSTITINSNTIVFASTGANKKANINFNNYTPKKNVKYKLTFTVTNFSGASIQARILGPNGNNKVFNTITANGTYVNTIPNLTSPTTQYNRFYFQAAATTTCTISNILLEEINPQRDVEFDDGLIDLAGWNNPRYNGSKLTGAKINEYNEGDVTYGLNPVAEQKSAAIYFGKSLIGADEEDDDLVTIRNHSYLDIEKIMLINKYTDEITTIDLKNENYDGINGYIANDFKDGSGFNIELLDDKITHKLRDSYKAKFNQGYLKKIIEHKGKNGTGVTAGEGIQAGYINTLESAPTTFKNGSNTQNVFCYGRANNTMNNDTLTLKSNPLTRQIWSTKDTFGLLGFNTGSFDFVNSGMQQLGTFINSMLIPIASESQYRLFGTLNLGQKQNQGNYGAPSDSGIKSISTFEIDLEKYEGNDATNGSLVSSSLYIDGVNRAIHIPNYLLLPIMQGPHDLMTSGIPAVGGNDTGALGSGITGVNLNHYWSGDGHKNAIYQLSYLEETNVIIADIDKPSELTNDVGDEGFVIIPKNIDKDIRDNLSFYLDKAGLKASAGIKKLPLRKL